MRKRQVVYLADALHAYRGTPFDDSLCKWMLGDAFILRETALFPYGDLGVIERKDANGIRKVSVKFVLPFETYLDVLTDVEVLVVFHTPHIDLSLPAWRKSARSLREDQKGHAVLASALAAQDLNARA